MSDSARAKTLELKDCAPCDGSGVITVPWDGDAREFACTECGGTGKDVRAYAAEQTAALRAALERKDALLQECCKHVPQALYVRIVDEAALLADAGPVGEEKAKFSIDVWGMHNGAPDEWVVCGPDGVISHHESLDEAESALAAVEKARKP